MSTNKHPKTISNKSSKQSKGAKKDTGIGIVLTLVMAALMFAYLSFLWLLIIIGPIIIIGCFVVDTTVQEKLIGIAIGLVLTAVGVLLARRIDKNIFNTAPWSM